METTKPKEMFQEDTKAAGFAAKNNHTTIMANYHNHLACVTGLYTNFFTNMVKLYPQPFHVTSNGSQNHEPLADFNNKVNNNVNAFDLSKKYKEVINSNFETSKSLFKSTVETNKKIMEDAHTHFNSSFNQAQAFFGELLKTYDKPLTEADAYTHESGLNDKTKKPSDPVNEVKDQKSK